jgi:tetratricopeptide (TPR) repeat protein
MGVVATAYAAHGRHSEASALWDKVLEVQKRVLRAEHVSTLGTMGSLAALQERTGNLKEAEELLRTLLAVSEKQKRDEFTQSSYRTRLGRVLVKERKFADAEPFLRSALAVREKQAPAFWMTSVTRYVLGWSLAGQEKKAEAEPLLVAGAEGLLKEIAALPELEHERVREALGQLILLYTNWGKPEQAAAWQKKLDEFNTTHAPDSSGQPPNPR